jgi:hypothetical protein
MELTLQIEVHSALEILNPTIALLPSVRRAEL